MAIAERWLAAAFQPAGFPLFDYDVYACAATAT
jgi:transketolase